MVPRSVDNCQFWSFRFSELLSNGVWLCGCDLLPLVFCCMWDTDWAGSGAMHCCPDWCTFCCLKIVRFVAIDAGAVLNVDGRAAFCPWSPWSVCWMCGVDFGICCLYKLLEFSPACFLLSRLQVEFSSNSRLWAPCQGWRELCRISDADCTHNLAQPGDPYPANLASTTRELLPRKHQERRPYSN